ncbi:MAG TPA: hypothetical protein VFH39_01935 [Candidatus Saccharimonadales bacterium]|nr:hypothetical protein [Candidatus Saccharimonadales bacterium]
MPTNPEVYPEHIVAPERLELARTILGKELRKLFLGLADDSWRAMDDSVRGWAEQPVKYHLEDGGPRDFWDSFAAFMESIKLKPDFTRWLTAENVRWSKQHLDPRELILTSPLDQLRRIPDIDLRTGMHFSEIADLLNRNPEARATQKKLIDEHSTDPAQDTYPIIVQIDPELGLKIMDGNRRTLKAVIYGKDGIDAWVAEHDGDDLRDFWVPVNDLYQLAVQFKTAQKDGDTAGQEAVARILRQVFAHSQVAKQTYEARVRDEAGYTSELYDMALRQR